MGRPKHSDTYLKQFGWNDDDSTGTSFVYYGGRYEKEDGTTVLLADSSVTIASGTNYIELTYSTGAVSSNQSGFTAGIGTKKLWVAVSNGSAITSVTDYRATDKQISSGGESGGITSVMDDIAFWALSN